MNDKQSSNALPTEYLNTLLNEYHTLEAKLADKYDSFNVPGIENDPIIIRIHSIWNEIESHTYQIA